MSIEKVAILGTNCLSTSIALGLKAQPQPPVIVGYDPVRAMAGRARSTGALDKVVSSPGKACHEADLVIIAVPLDEIRDLLHAIALHLKRGCLVTDIAHLKVPVWEWAQEQLPKDISFVGGHIVLNPVVVGSNISDDPTDAGADLLRAALYCILPLPDTPKGTIDIFTRLVSALGAVPFFPNVVEHDGIQAGVSALPDLLSIALLEATVSGPAEVDMRRFAGENIATMTDIAAEEIHKRVLEIFLNKGNVILQLENLVRILSRMRDMLLLEDRDAFEEMFFAAIEGRARWLEERERGLWMQERRIDLSDVPSSGQQLQRLFFTEPPDMARRPRR